MKKLKLDNGGRPLWNEDLVNLSAINVFLDKIIEGRGNTPYVISGCVLGTPTGSVYPISAGIVFLNGKLLSVDATTQNLSSPKYLGEGTPVESSNRVFETGSSFTCTIETKAVYSASPLSGANFTVNTGGVGTAEQKFWSSFATDNEVASAISSVNSNLSTNYYTNTQVDEIVGSLDENLSTFVDDKFVLSWNTLVDGTEYTKDQFGFVHLKGLLNMTVNASTIYATLPVGFRPANTIYYQEGVNGNGNYRYVQILPNGSVYGEHDILGGDTNINLELLPTYFAS